MAIDVVSIIVFILIGVQRWVSPQYYHDVDQ